jgi:hypothetical protein
LPYPVAARLEKVPRSEVTISTRVQSLKVFSNKYIFKYAKLTTRDLLAKVELPSPPERTYVATRTQSCSACWTCTRAPRITPEIRDRALLCLLASTALRTAAVRMPELSPVWESCVPRTVVVPSRRKFGFGRAREAVCRVFDPQLSEETAFRTSTLDRGTGLEPATSTLGTLRQASFAVFRGPLPSWNDRELSPHVHCHPQRFVVKTVIKAT